MQKVSFNLDPGEWHLTPSEAVWAEPLNAAGTYRVQNTPYFVKGISYLDEITATMDPRYGFLEFTGVVLARSGHSTYRLVVDTGEARFASLWNKLQDIGCTYECVRGINTSMGIKDLFAVDVPANTDIYEAYKIMKQGEDEGVWLFQEGHVGHKLRDVKSSGAGSTRRT